jgi:GNAT superfamily N-acetyltransferase
VGSDRQEVTDLRVAPLTAALAGAWADLFDRAHVGCFCRWWHFHGTKNDWLARCAMSPDTSRGEAALAIDAGSTEATGLVALRGEVVVGWMKIAPRASLPKLRGLPVYRARLAKDEEGAWSIGCLLVDPAERRRGVARSLLAAAPAFARDRGASFLEGYPRHVPATRHGPLYDEEAWMGPEAIFAELGFTRVDAEEEAYPLWRLAL